MKYDIVNMSGRLESRMRKLERDAAIPAGNKKTIHEFDSFLMSRGLTMSRRYKYITMLSWLSGALGKPFMAATKEDILLVVAAVESSKQAEWTKADRRVTVKRFYKWLKGNDEEYPPEVKWIRCSVKNHLMKMPEELLTEEDVKKLADASNKPRDKAFVQILYESGCRIGEMMSIQLRNVSFDEYGAVLKVSGKTGDRRVRIVASAPALATWMDFHPCKGDPEAYLWVRTLREGAREPLPFCHQASVKLLRNLAKAAGVKKKVNPHLFRHSRATVLANKLTEAQMKEYFGWVQGSDMASVYVHLSGRDVDNAILDVYGLRKEKKAEEERFGPSLCPRCGSANSPASKLCTKCGYGFDMKTTEPENRNVGGTELLSLLMKDPEFQAMILKKLSENGKSEVMEVIQ